MDKFIVDTSVWIDFFHDKLKESICQNLIIGIENEQAVITDIIMHELVMGTQTKKQFKHMIDLFSPMTKLRISDDEQENYNEFSWKTFRKGLPGKYTDLTIAYLSSKYKYPVLSFDQYFYKLAKSGFIKVINL
ncbi:MAG: PIN domain-containing protein [bacterium]|nr:PIN domain-containing protein [bacterium]MBU1918485.1 PIN domain-containing protein [bacterium]